MVHGASVATSERGILGDTAVLETGLTLRYNIIIVTVQLLTFYVNESTTIHEYEQ